MTLFKLPDLGEGLPDAEIQQWYVAEGDEIKLDQPLVAMETAKAVVDVPSPYTGRIVKLHGKPGDIIKTGDTLVTYVVHATEDKLKAVSEDSGTVVGVIETSDKLLEGAATGITVPTSARAGIKISPSVRALAMKLNVDLTHVQATGPANSISADDIHRAANQATPVIGEPLQGARRIMAMQMAKSHAEVAAVTLMDDADLHQWQEKTDVTVRLLEALIAACHAEPLLNAHFYGSTASRQLFKEINIGIAVDTPHGLYVPVIADAANLSAAELRNKLNEFKIKAAEKSFSPADLQNSTITLSNFGTLSGRYATPIVVPPTVAIVGIGKTRPQPVAVAEKLAIHTLMPISLTFDHRAVTGGEAARFLAEFIKNLQ